MSKRDLWLHAALSFEFLPITTYRMFGLSCSILLSVWIGKSHSSLLSCDSSTGFDSWSYQCWKQSKPKFWQSLLWMHLPIWSCLQPLFSFWANFLHFVTMWLMVYSRSPHIPHNGDISSPSILFLILLALNAWSRAVIMRPSVSIVETPILRQSQVSVLRSCLAAKEVCDHGIPRLSRIDGLLFATHSGISLCSYLWIKQCWNAFTVKF